MEESGGFLPPAISPCPPSPSSTIPQALPHPRSHALRPGSSKESAFVNYVDSKLQEVSGRFARRFQTSDGPRVGATNNGTNGYRSFIELAEDLEGALDAVWVSGTPVLQIPFLLTIAASVLTYMEPFPFAPRATLGLLGKLDVAFSSLLRGEDVDTGNRLPGFETGRKVTTTEKVRLRSIVERTRIHVVKLAGSPNAPETELDNTTASDTDLDSQYDETFVGQDEWDMGIARVYEKTLVELGNDIEVPSLSAT